MPSISKRTKADVKSSEALAMTVYGRDSVSPSAGWTKETEGGVASKRTDWTPEIGLSPPRSPKAETA